MPNVNRIIQPIIIVVKNDAKGGHINKYDIIKNTTKLCTHGVIIPAIWLVASYTLASMNCNTYSS